MEWLGSMITVTLSWHKKKNSTCFFTKFVSALIQYSSNVQSITPVSGHGTADGGNAVSTSPAFF